MASKNTAVFGIYSDRVSVEEGVEHGQLRRLAGEHGLDGELEQRAPAARDQVAARPALEGLAVPQDQGLPLIGDPDRTHVARVDARSVERELRAGLDGGPDLVWVVLHPTRTRVVLRDLAVSLAAHFAIGARYSGNTIALYINGIEIGAPMTDSAFTTGGMALCTTGVTTYRAWQVYAAS